MTNKTLARRIWPTAVWIVGDGAWASVSTCNDSISVMLHKTKKDADSAKTRIDESACGGNCIRNAGHNVVMLDSLITVKAL